MNGSGHDRAIGGCLGRVAPSHDHADFIRALAELEYRVRHAGDDLGSGGRNRNLRLALSCGGSTIAAAVKVFGSQAAAKDWLDRRRGSKARRTWEAAIHLAGSGVGTPAPLAFLERWVGSRLHWSCYVSEFQEGSVTFKQELIRLFDENPRCDHFMALLLTVATAIRRMHDAGLIHHDLGNQNILLRRQEEGWWDRVQFVDLNRARVRSALTPAQRGRDLSRIYLPSDLLRVFLEMYYGDVKPPQEFLDAERMCRRLYAVHAGTRDWRHPSRVWRRWSGRGPTEPKYPSEKAMWIWDWRSAQAISVMRPADRLKYYPWGRHLETAGATLRGVKGVWKEYRQLLQDAYRHEVNLAGRLGMAVNPERDTWDRERRVLAGLGLVPVLVRFCHHASDAEQAFVAEAVRDLSTAGHAVSIALVQDRPAVLEPDRWRRFVGRTLEAVGDRVDGIEIGHAINRVKWGVWDYAESTRLMEGVLEAAAGHPGLRFMGPAVIDFEYPFLMAALRRVPAGLRFHALSHHLYVDRRGAPENRQDGFDSLGKFALARAIARRSGVCDDRLIVSEVSWPLLGTGVFSPVTSPYESVGPRFNDPSVSEDLYADYMVRYLLIALCSGMVERVFWWRLVARGFGLVDDSDAAAWRERPAYRMFQYLVRVLAEAVFVERPAILTASGQAEGRGPQGFGFRLPDGRRVWVAYTTTDPCEGVLPFAFGRATDAEGIETGARSGEPVFLSGRPAYFFSAP